LTKAAYAADYTAASIKSYEGGAVLFDSEAIDSLGGVSFIESSLQSPHTEYRLLKIFNSRMSNGRSYFRYQEYYKGLEVESRGYTLMVDGEDDPNDVYLRPIGPGPGPGPAPCARILGISPNTLSFTGMNVTPTITDRQAARKILAAYRNASVKQSELIIITDEQAACVPKLMYRTFFTDQVNKVAYINALSGVIERTQVTDAHLNAPTPTYGTVDLDDTVNGNGDRWLVSGDGRVRTHDFGNAIINNLLPASYTDATIPTTTGTNWFNAGHPSLAYQAHFVVTEAMPAFDAIGVEFGNVSVGVSTDENANALGQSTIAAAFINFGFFGGPTALRDVAGHELGHCIIFESFPGTTISGGTLHEGIADMFGAYAESVTSPNGLNWVVGNDDPGVQAAVNRDAAFPSSSCFDDVINFGWRQRYLRAAPLTHWFHNIVSGDATSNISAFGIQFSTTLVLDALGLIASDQNGDFDYEQFRDATLLALDMQSGLCSPAYQSVALAWDDICVTTPDCAFSISGPISLCDDDRTALFSAINGLPGIIYRWTFPIEWTVQGGQGNFFQGNSLNVTNIPSYSSYPKTLTIRAATLPNGSTNNLTRTIVIRDCTGSGGCGPVPLDRPQSGEFRGTVMLHNDLNDMDCEDCKYILYNLNGQEVRSGNGYFQNDLSSQDYNLPPGLYLIAKFSKQNHHLVTQKIIVR
jgi:hypothetical protein